MKLSILAAAAAMLLGATEAMELIFYNGQGCRGARLTSESRGTGGCHAFDGAKSNTASIQVIRQSGDGNNSLADEDGAGITNTLNSPPETLPKVKESAGPTYLDLSGQPPCQLYKDSNRAELQDLYFSKFNTTWPLLDRDDFYNSPQPSSLVDSVLVVGMYMKGTPEAKALAMECHEVLIKSAVHFFTVVLPLVSASCPRVDLLSEFQTLMLPAILALYNVDDGACFLQTFLCNKNIFTLFDQIGVYDQRRIDAEVSSPTHREQYQR
ncbi:hypothetical protein ACHAQA_007795 [Verticillium albo-atrum]